MKKIYILIALLAGISSTGFCNTPVFASEGDSIIILFGKKTQIVIQSEDREELKKLKNFDFNALISQVITATEASQNTSATKDTSFVVNGDTIVMRGSEVTVKDNDSGNKVTFSIRIGKDTNETSEVEVTEDDSTIVIIRSRTTPRVRVNIDRHERRKNRRTDKEFVLDLGLNNYLENGQFPDENNAVYGLRPFGSRYIALGYQFQTRIGSKKSPLSLNYGLEFSANNFMFDNDARIRKGDNQVIIEAENNLDLKKSKLTVLYVSLPVMPMLNFGNNNFRIGAGGFVGYRVHSYSKIMYFDDGKRKDHEQSNYYLSNFRYGLMAQIGFKGINLFAKYDLNPLFSPGKGPNANADLHALSFGIRL